MADEQKTVQERLAAARAAKAAKEAALAHERDEAELARLELETRLEKELGGRLGREFVIVDVTALGEGFVAMKLGEDVIFNTFVASKMNVVDVDAFVTPCLVHPSKEEYRKLAARRPYVAQRCSTELAKLYGFAMKEEAGK